MNEADETAWIYAGNCPVCQCGLRRIRVCEAADGQLRGYVMCDECEAIWLSPDVASDYRFPNAEKPICPVTDDPLYGPQSRWASVEDVQTIGWMDQVTTDSGVEPCAAGGTPEPLVAPEDAAGDLDAPTAVQLSSAIVSPLEGACDSTGRSQPLGSDPSYGSDEPRPGC